MRLSHPLNSLRDKWRWFVINSVASCFWTPVSLRRRLLRSGGVEFDVGGHPPLILSRCTIYGKAPLRIGAGAFINVGCQFHCDAPIEIGANCAVAMETLFCTATHEIGDATRREGASVAFPIRIGEGCWIGARATILPGVSVGPGCVIAAGAVIAKDCAPNGLYGGVPARRLRDL